jgi:hypothetical protein
MASHIFVLALGAAVLGSGTSGGEIRHTEIRDNNVNTAVENVKLNTESATDENQYFFNKKNKLN